MGIKIKHTDPTLNEFSTDDVVINVQSGSLFFKSNTKLFKLQGDDQSTTDISDSLIITGLINSRGPKYTVELDGNHGSGPRINMGTSPFNTSIPNDSDLFMSFGAYSSINNLDTKDRDFHLYGTNTTTGFYFDESEGNFGIGITAPTALLHLGTQGSAASNTDPSLTRLALTPPAHTGGPWNFVTRDNSTHAFLDIDYGSYNKITINSDGDVGIGTTNPSAPLHVEGTVEVSGSRYYTSGSAANQLLGIASTGSILPGVNSDGTTGFDLGSPTAVWRDLWLSQNSVRFVSSSGEVTRFRQKDAKSLREGKPIKQDTAVGGTDVFLRTQAIFHETADNHYIKQTVAGLWDYVGPGGNILTIDARTSHHTASLNSTTSLLKVGGSISASGDLTVNNINGTINGGKF